MKRFIRITLFSIVFPLSSFAQDYQNQFVVTVGSCYSVTTSSTRIDINSSLRDNGFSTLNSIKVGAGFIGGEFTLPILNFQLDYALNERFSIGVGYNFTKFSTDQTGLISDTLYHAIVSLSKQNIGVRSLYHFSSFETLDMYVGARLGLTVWNGEYSIKNDFGDNKATLINTSNKSTFQLLFGVRKYFNDLIGVTFEAGLGSPYLLSYGLSFRIN